ncbi:MAG: hypothetical protein HY302_10305 [Opitutae bacterium]|nr:hypothetical protein [Opitutae bacterium]
MPKVQYLQADHLRFATEAGDLTVRLAAKSAEVRKLLPPTASKSDLRERAIYHLASVAHDLSIGHLVIAGSLIYPSWWRQFECYRDGSDEQLMGNTNHYLTSLRRSVFFSMFMVTENHLRLVHRFTVNGGNDNYGIRWWEIIDATLKQLGFEKHETRQLLSILTYMRNSIHNNGVITQPDAKIKWRAQNYVFVKGYPSDGYTSEFLIVAIEAIADLMVEVAKHPAVLAVPDVENLGDRLGQVPTVQKP